MEDATKSTGSALHHPIVIDYRRSGRLHVFIILSHLGALLCLHWTELPWVAIFLASLLILGSYTRTRWLNRLEQARYILTRDNQWFVIDENGRQRPLKRLPGTLVHPGLVIVRLADPGRRRRDLILTRDNLDPAVLRRLCVRLRYPGD